MGKVKESELSQGWREVVKGVIEREGILIAPFELEGVKGGREVIKGVVEIGRRDDEGVKERREGGDGFAELGEVAELEKAERRGKEREDRLGDRVGKSNMSEGGREKRSLRSRRKGSRRGNCFQSPGEVFEFGKERKKRRGRNEVHSSKMERGER